MLEPAGGQVPWHNHEQEEIYHVLEGTGEMCVGEDVPPLPDGAQPQCTDASQEASQGDP